METTNNSFTPDTQNLQKLVTSLTSDTQELDIDYKDATKISEASPILVGGPEVIEITEIDPRTIEQWLFAHPVVPRGIEIKANKIVGRGYNITGPNEEANLYIETILKNSGGVIFLKKFVENGFAFGNGFGELIANKAKNEILKCDLLHPVYFGFAKKKVSGPAGEIWQIVLDPASQKPMGFQQYRVQDEVLAPFGAIIPKDRVMHVAFDTWGDEVEGISIIQYLQTTLRNLITIESAGAAAGQITANPRYKFKTNIKSEKSLKKFAAAVDGINDRDAIILSEGNDVEVLSPGITNFNEYHDKFLSLISTKLGIPKPILFGDGTSTNKATLTEQTTFMREENRLDEEMLKQTVQNQLIDIAIKVKYGENFAPENIPQFDLKGFVGDDTIVVERIDAKTTIINKLVDSITKLEAVGKTAEADVMLKYLMENILEHVEENTER